MDIIRGNKLEHYLDRIFGDRKPITAEIMLTDFCNYTCSYCRYNKGKIYINFEQFKVIVDRLLALGVKGFILSGGGEPLLNPDIDLILGYLKDNKIPYGVNTNLSVYKQMAGASWVKVSIHEGQGSISNVLANIKRLKAENSEVVVGIQNIVKEVKDIREWYDKYKDIDVDYMSFRPLEMVEPQYDIFGLEDIIIELLDLQLKDKRVVVSPKWGYIFDKGKGCPANWSVITVRWDMQVIYCCHKPDEVVGNILDLDILDKKDEYKTDFCTCEKPCRLTTNNKYLNDIANYRKVGHYEFI